MAERHPQGHPKDGAASEPEPRSGEHPSSPRAGRVGGVGNISAVPPAPTLWLAADAIAEDAEALAALHDRELAPALVDALHEAKFPACLGLMPATKEFAAAWRAMAEGMRGLPRAGDAAGYDDLAAEYAAIYLTGAYGASSCESVWIDDDHLGWQQPMFEWREIHARAGLKAVDWRQRPDDHLVLQLLYIAHAARHARTRDDWRALAAVLDEHTLRWVPNFALRVAARTMSAFYAALAMLTAAWLDTLRDLLARELGEERPMREEIERRLQARRTAARSEKALPLQFVPGAAPSW